MLPVVEVMWVERSGACEAGFVVQENIYFKKSQLLLLPQAPTYKLFTREVVGLEQILHFLEIIRM